VEISFDPAKRDKTLKERGLDFADAARIFEGPTLTLLDDRFDYDEARYQTYGLLGDRLVMVVWIDAPPGRRIISMRKTNEREQARFRKRLG